MENALIVGLCCVGFMNPIGVAAGVRRQRVALSVGCKGVGSSWRQNTVSGMPCLKSNARRWIVLTIMVVHMNILLVPILSQINPVHTAWSPSLSFSQIHLNTILPPTPRSSE
jgi:hypothetical protein